MQQKTNKNQQSQNFHNNKKEICKRNSRHWSSSILNPSSTVITPANMFTPTRKRYQDTLWEDETPSPQTSSAQSVSASSFLSMSSSSQSSSSVEVNEEEKKTPTYHLFLSISETSPFQTTSGPSCRLVVLYSDTDKPDDLLSVTLFGSHATQALSLLRTVAPLTRITLPEIKYSEKPYHPSYIKHAYTASARFGAARLMLSLPEHVHEDNSDPNVEEMKDPQGVEQKENITTTCHPLSKFSTMKKVDLSAQLTAYEKNPPLPNIEATFHTVWGNNHRLPHLFLPRSDTGSTITMRQSNNDIHVGHLCTFYHGIIRRSGTQRGWNTNSQKT